MDLSRYLALLLPVIQPYLTEIVIGLVVIGLVNCVWGYRWLAVAKGSQGFLAGVILGGALGIQVGVDLPSQALLVVMICGFTGAVMSLAYDRLAFFLMGGLTGALLIQVAMISTGGFTSLILVAAGALVGGCLVAVMGDAASMVTTPLIGGWVLTVGMALILGLLGQDLVKINITYKNALGLSTWFNLAWLVFTSAGLVIQQGILKRNKSNERNSPVKLLLDDVEEGSNVAVKLSGGITDKNGHPVKPGDIGSK